MTHIAARQRVHAAVRRLAKQCVEGELSARGIRWSGVVGDDPVKGPLNNPVTAPEWYVAHDIGTAIHEGIAGALDSVLDIYDAIIAAELDVRS